ncbi:hypothetical protein NFI96_017719 [Prochilodus magdalenae]|nr:hypothetical protein NFI96_017719 [Prochilodus magdalenae]
METGVGVIMWTILLVTTASELRGESMTSTSPPTPALTLKDLTSIAIHVTPRSNLMETPQAVSAHVSKFPPHDESMHTAATAFSPQSEPNTHSDGTVSSPAPVSSTETAPASSDTSPSLIPSRSTTIAPGSMITASTIASTSLSEEHQTSSHQSTISASEATPAASSASYTRPDSTQTAVTDKTQPTGPVPLEDPRQDGASELDVGDEDSAKVPPASPWDPLLAALVSIFIVSTALVSLMLFLRFRQQSEHPEFHRLQDLPMLEYPHTVPADGAVGVEGHQAFWTCDNKPFISVLTTVPPHTDSLGVSTKTKVGLVTEDDPLPF